MTVVSVKVICNGQTYELSKGSGDVWSTTFTAPTETSGSNNAGQGPGVGANAQGKGYYPVTVIATDDAGNDTTITTDDAQFGSILKLAVLEKTKPTCAFSYPTAGATITNSKPNIQFSVSDAGSGVDPSKVYIKIDDGAETPVTPTGTGSELTCSYTPSTALSEGAHTVVIRCLDYDGNQSDSVSMTFKVDTVPPVLNVTSPAEGAYFNVASIEVSGSTNDATSSPVTVKILVGQTQYDPVVQSDGSFSQAVTLAEGANVIQVIATDAAGKESTVTRNVTLDSAAPVISAITLQPNPSDGGASLSIQVTVTDA